jgi:hypothetical protein
MQSNATQRTDIQYVSGQENYVKTQRVFLHKRFALLSRFLTGFALFIYTLLFASFLPSFIMHSSDIWSSFLCLLPDSLFLLYSLFLSFLSHLFSPSFFLLSFSYFSGAAVQGNAIQSALFHNRYLTIPFQLDLNPKPAKNWSADRVSLRRLGNMTYACVTNKCVSRLHVPKPTQTLPPAELIRHRNEIPCSKGRTVT